MRVLDFLTDSTVIFFVANSLYVISYMLTSMVWLRLLAIIAAVSTVPYFYFQVEPLWSALFWQGCFLLVNLVNLLILLYHMRATQFDPDEQQAFQLRFSDLKPHEARPIFKHADRISPAAESLLLSEGEPNESLYLILEGECRVRKGGREVAVLRPGQFVGEISFISGEAVSADVVSSGETRLMVWNRKKLEPLFRRQGLYEAYFHSQFGLDLAGKLRTMTAGASAG
ncbi:MAG: cyclic nucleotide-binding domain-containing protein [Xanthomonadales bacterium]|nr:cyclic nucleotide-binding domain-containing protein [Gammaproteobacteria bacterium]MBT8055247.1 cyclic nucleotide-binding domain-containing protein [Gammaproteobacteria bacterium]NND57019.1 cyclic nucleotide-binding domain-containing protein [Xanthomonadales bacterium]NNK51888.1 cyclic nucleotide-binding domain-containing protein [Xanthomonadales bacterium]